MEYDRMISLVNSVSKIVNGYLLQIGGEDNGK
jgi:hypothetical protein